MELKEFDIILDIKRSIKNENIEVVQGDKETNVFYIQLQNGINPYSLIGVNVEIAFAKPDGTTVIQDSENGVSIINGAGGEIMCVLKTNTIAAHGEVLAEVRIYDMKSEENSPIYGRLLTTANFRFFVRRSIVNDETIKSTDEFTILDKLIGEVNPLIQECETLLGEVDTLLTQVDTKIGEMDTFLTVVGQSEDQRVRSERIRQDTEDLRVRNEAKRQRWEEERILNEQTRGYQENLRQTNTTNIINEAEDKITDVENRFQTLTTEQQQDAEVIDARQGKTSLVANIQEFKDEFAAHKAENVHQQEVHGLKIEKGTWTPVLVGSTVAGAHTYSQQVGRYTKIDNLVYISMRLAITSVDSNASGDLNIAGLPFISISQDTGLTISSLSNVILQETYKQIFARTILNTSRIQLIRVSSTTYLPAIMNLDDMNSTNLEIRLSGVYETN